MLSGISIRQKNSIKKYEYKKEPCDDAVSREAVLNLCTNDKYNIPYEYEDDKGIHRGYDEYRLINYYKLKQLPPVTQKSGKWIDGDSICPCCGEDKFKDLDADIWSDWQPKYCPNCGAKMVEPQESEGK